MHQFGKRHQHKLNRIKRAVEKGIPFDSLQDKIIYENVYLIGYTPNIFRTLQQKRDLEEWLDKMFEWAEFFLSED